MQGQTAAPPAPAARPVALIDKLETTRRGVRQFRRARGWLTAAAVGLVLAALLALADWTFVLRPTTRAAGLLAVAAVVAAIVWRRVLSPDRRFDRSDAAAEVEAGFPELGQRVRTTLDYAEPGGDRMPAHPGFVRELTLDTDRRTTGLDFLTLIPWRSVRRGRLALAGLALLVLTPAVCYQEGRIAAARLFLWPADYTQLAVTPGDHRLKVGQDFTVEANLSGRPVHDCVLHHREAGGEWQQVSFAPEDDASRKMLGTFQTTLPACQADLEYRVTAGPVESRTYRLSILRPLVLKNTEATIEPPAYTRRPASVVPSPNVTVPEGTRVGLRFTLDRPPQEARLLVKAGDAAPTPVPLRVEGAELIGELTDLRQTVDFEVEAAAADGMKLEASKFRVTVKPDRQPTVRFVKPKDQIEVIPTAEVPVRVEAGDDYGVARIGVVYQVGSGPKKTLTLREESANPARAVLDAVLTLEDHELSFQDGVTYFAFAEDNHPTQPQRAVTALQFIDVRPFKREYQLLKTGGS